MVVLCPGFRGVEILELVPLSGQEDSMARKGYPTEFRRRALDLLVTGRKVVDVARDLGISDQTLYTWRRQECIDRVKSPTQHRRTGGGDRRPAPDPGP